MSEMHANDDALVFMDELSAEHLNDMNTPLPSWRVMIIDDDPDVHSATMFALGNLEIQNRSRSFLHAYSASEARQILAQ